MFIHFKIFIRFKMFIDFKIFINFKIFIRFKIFIHFKIFRSTGLPMFTEEFCKLFVFLRFMTIQTELLSISAVAVNRWGWG